MADGVGGRALAMVAFGDTFRDGVNIGYTGTRSWLVPDLS